MSLTEAGIPHALPRQKTEQKILKRRAAAAAPAAHGDQLSPVSAASAAGTAGAGKTAAPAQRIRGASLRRALNFVTAAWLFGSVWATATAGAPITVFAEKLGASEFQFGVLSALPFIASLLSMPASLLIDRTGARKGIFLLTLYVQRVMWLPIGLVPLWMVHRGGAASAPAAMLVLLVLLFFMHASGNVGAPAWVSWMADLVPQRSRGRYFSRRRQLGILPSIPAAWAAGWILDRYAGNDPVHVIGVCSILFVCSAVFGIMDIAAFEFVPAIPMRPKLPGEMRKVFTEPLKSRQFLWFAGFVATLTFAVSFMGQFVTLYLIEQVGAGNTGTQMIVMVAPMLAQLATLGAWGIVADRMGKKPVLVLASLGLVPVGLGWCFMTGGSIWLGFVLSALGGLLWAGIEVANFNLVLELSGGGEVGGSGFAAVNSVIINIAGCFGGLASGVIAELLRHWHWTPAALGFKTFNFYDVLFALSGVLRLLAVAIFLPHIHEPAARPSREALRFMTANIYNNLFNAVLQPLRLVGIGRDASYESR